MITAKYFLVTILFVCALQGMEDKAVHAEQQPTKATWVEVANTLNFAIAVKFCPADDSVPTCMDNLMSGETRKIDSLPPFHAVVFYLGGWMTRGTLYEHPEHTVSARYTVGYMGESCAKIKHEAFPFPLGTRDTPHAIDVRYEGWEEISRIQGID